MIEFSKVEFRYRAKRRVVLEDFSIRFDGEPTLLLGPNGAGKSTLLKLAAGLERPAAGGLQPMAGYYICRKTLFPCRV